MSRDKPEIVPADKRVRQNLLIMMAAYSLFLLWLEPLVDFLLSFDPLAADPLSMADLNRKKVRYAGVAFAAARSLPVGFLFWLGYRIVASAGIPPAGMKFPVTVQRIKGRQARMFGLLLMGICLCLIYWEMAQLSRKLFV